MRFVESIFGKLCHFIKYFVGGCLINSIAHATWNHYIAVLVHLPMDENFSFFCHHIQLFLSHGTAHQIGSTCRIARQITHNLHDLLLIHHTAIRDIQNRLQCRMRIFIVPRIQFSLDVTRNLVHWTWTIKRNTSNNILQTIRLQFLHKGSHSATFKLENPIRIAFLPKFINFWVIHIFIKFYVNPTIFLDQLLAIFNHSQGSKPQKIHF